MFTIFAAVSDQGTKYLFRRRLFFVSILLYFKIQGCHSHEVHLLNEYGSLVGKSGGDSLSYIYNFSYFMTREMENYSVANNSTNTVTSAHETCEKFIAFIRERYPQIQSPHFKISRTGRFLTIRGAFHRRRIFAYGYDFEKVFSYFTKQCLIKMTMDKYYISVAEAKEKKPLEPFFAGIKCRIIQNNKEIISD